ncbi:ABC transporter permease [Microaerobacter geothermalis]|uniref:ABC transporter permease n=1 Tax=Microaerobacter geothermalis TaxID=674972 RepID=UPI001F43C6BF|nr:ABC transporter permease [Microaerobacter geothermalis]MCF6092663.1 ABC transporter permease [Microaerobacter geothermalis]
MRKSESKINQWLTRGGQSAAHGEYLKKLRIEKWMVFFTQLVLLAVLLALWEWASALKWIDPLLFSRPSKIWNSFYAMLINGDLHYHIFITVVETLAGFLLGTILGTVIAITIWTSNFLAKVLDPYIVVLNGMPKVALGPIFIVAFGGGYGAIISMAVAVSVIITIIVVYSSFKEVDDNYIRMAKTFGATKSQIFQKIIFPASFPTVISTLKVNVGLSWVGVIVGEFLVSKAGLGYLIIYGFQVFNLTLVFISLLIIAICATLMYQGVTILEKRMMKHRGIRDEN